MQRTLVIIGVLLVLVGLLWPWLSQLPLGRLPGDIAIRRDDFSFFLPITSMLLVSLLLSALVWLFRG